MAVNDCVLNATYTPSRYRNLRINGKKSCSILKRIFEKTLTDNKINNFKIHSYDVAPEIRITFSFQDGDDVLQKLNEKFNRMEQSNLGLSEIKMSCNVIGSGVSNSVSN